MHDTNYVKKIILEFESVLAVDTKYPEYPITFYENDYFWVCIEGKIYGKDSNRLRAEIDSILDDIFFQSKYKDRGPLLKNWLLTTDGEFIIYALNKKDKDIVVFNDALGRLPLYYYNDDSILILSREIGLIADVIHQSDNWLGNESIFDKMAIAQYLLFGFPLDKRTLLNGIFRIQPGSLITIVGNRSPSPIQEFENKNSLLIENLYTFNFEAKKYSNESFRHNTDRLASLLSQACKDRADPEGNNIISLSGGFDSRTIAECLHSNSISCSAISYKEPGWVPLLGNKSEAEIAQLVSNSLNYDWKNYGRIAIRGSDILMLLAVKRGSIHLGYSFMIPILERVRNERSSKLTIFICYGGDRILVNLKIPRKSRNMNDLALNILNREGYLTFPYFRAHADQKRKDP